jgi:hypothetical protein
MIGTIKLESQRRMRNNFYSMYFTSNYWFLVKLERVSEPFRGLFICGLWNAAVLFLNFLSDPTFVLEN